MKNLKDIPVRTVSAMFGVNPNTLRTWERRYGFPCPSRGQGSHRLYSPQVVDQIGQIVKLISQGQSVSAAIETVQSTSPRESAGEFKRAQILENQVSEAVEQMRFTELPALLEQSVTEIGYRETIEQVAFPVLSTLGTNWETYPTSIGKEHALSLAVHSAIGRQQLRIDRVTLPSITLACCPGELHQLPVLHLANLLMEDKIASPLVLTAGLPIEETLAIARATGSLGILLSCTLPPKAPDLSEWLRNCMDKGWQHRIILSGGGFSRSKISPTFPIRIIAPDFNLAANQLRSFLEEMSMKKEQP